MWAWFYINGRRFIADEKSGGYREGVLLSVLGLGAAAYLYWSTH